jgi:site-specific recombinase XerD
MRAMNCGLLASVLCLLAVTTTTAASTGKNATAPITSGTLFRSINKAGRVWGMGFTPKVIWSIVKQAALNSGLARVAPHDLRRTCAKLCHEAGGELEQIQFLLGYVSVQTTERYLGCKQRFRNAVNDHIGLEPGSS